MFRLFAFTNYFEKGYFINNNDERTICLIKNLDWRYNPRAFHYKLSEESVVVSENIDGVKEFGIDNESCYKRFTAKIERSLNETNYLNYEKNPVFKEETLFLKTVASGSANLYSYTDENVIKYFYETASKPIEQLVRVRYLSKDSITSYEESVAENNLFRLQLIGALKCSAMAESDFRRLEYKKAPLAKVFEKFNSCNGDPKINGIDFSQKANRKSFAFKIAPGVFAANMAISDPSGFYSVSTDLTQTALKLGFEIEYILPFAKGS